MQDLVTIGKEAVLKHLFRNFCEKKGNRIFLKRFMLKDNFLTRRAKNRKLAPGEEE